jgi:hypothetical protein
VTAPPIPIARFSPLTESIALVFRRMDGWTRHFTVSKQSPVLRPKRRKSSAIPAPAANPGEFPPERGGPLVGVTKVILGGDGLWSMIRTDFQETPE